MRISNIKAEIRKEIKKPVFPEGSERAKVVFVGEAGGRVEEKLGRPFVGRAGNFLDKELEKFGIKREKVYITNVVKYRCIGAPKKSDIKKCEKWLEAEIKAIKPKVVVLLGKTAEKYTPRFKGIKYLCLPHPAAAMRFPKQKKLFESGMRKLKRLIKS